MNDDVAAQVEIRNLLAGCTQAGDARKADTYANCFTEDGVLELGEPIVGREAIRQWMAGASLFGAPGGDSSGGGSGGSSAGFISHHLTTSRIELSGPETATVRTYWLVTSAAGLDHNGYYDDRLVKVGEDWLIARRRPRTLWVSPQSVIIGEVRIKA